MEKCNSKLCGPATLAKVLALAFLHVLTSCAWIVFHLIWCPLPMQRHLSKWIWLKMLRENLASKTRFICQLNKQVFSNNWLITIDGHCYGDFDYWWSLIIIHCHIYIICCLELIYFQQSFWFKGFISNILINVLSPWINATSASSWYVHKFQIQCPLTSDTRPQVTLLHVSAT